MASSVQAVSRIQWAGRPGAGKSALIKALALRLMAYRVRAFLQVARIGVICGVPACPEAVQAQVP